MAIDTKDAIRAMVEPVVIEHGLELVDLQLRKEGRGLVLRIIIHRDDSEGGVSVDDCSAVSRELGYLLEVNAPLNRAYTLEVSSPGLDRPLKSYRDFERNLGKKITIQYREEGDNCSLTGTIERVAEDGKVIVKTAKKETVIPLDEIIKAIQVIEF